MHSFETSKLEESSERNPAVECGPRRFWTSGRKMNPLFSPRTQPYSVPAQGKVFSSEFGTASDVTHSRKAKKILFGVWSFLVCIWILSTCLLTFKESNSLRKFNMHGQKSARKRILQSSSTLIGTLLGHGESVQLPKSRYLTPWREVIPPRIKNIKEARGRIVYSAVREIGSDGLGHSMATINADVSAALRLGVAYSHRVGYHGSLTEEDNDAVETFFGWGDGAIQRETVSEACAVTVGERKGMECAVCELDSRRWKHGSFDQVVNIPVNLTYKFPFMSKEEGAYWLGRFLRAHNESNTLFQMPPSLCSKSPTQTQFDPSARAYFYDRYWRRRARAVTELDMDDSELTIAVHVRRGDFFIAKRSMTSIASFGHAIRQILSVVQEHGGPFSRMRAAVLIFSEGTPTSKDGKWHGHDTSKMDATFLDSFGIPRNEKWVHQHIIGNESTLFPNGLRVDMRISTDTFEAVQEMIAADVFLGSLSGLSTNLVGSFSRAGIIGLPYHNSVAWNGHCIYWIENGSFLDRNQLEKSWREYAEKHRQVATRALEGK